VPIGEYCKMVSITESSRLFGDFNDCAAKIEDALSRSAVDDCRKLIGEIQERVNSQSSALPARDLQTYLGRIEEFKRRMDEMKGPRKRFGFSKNTKQTHEEKLIKVLESGDLKAEEDVDKTPAVKSTIAGCEFSLCDKEDECVVLDEVQGDVELKNLKGCQIRIRGSPNTIYISNIDNCTLTSDPISSSVLIVGCRNCDLQLACQQLRIHKASDSKIRLHITSRSIIEDCSGVSFAPLSPSYDAADDLWISSGLNREKNNFDCVDDFNWLNTDEASPNWTIVRDAE